MSAEVLRKAASLARELADKAAAQPSVKVNVEGVWLNSRFYMVTTPERERAIADWLEQIAVSWHLYEGHAIRNTALVAAHVYLNTPNKENSQ